MGKEILLHVCCGPCSTACIERLMEEGFTPVLFYSDSNIYPFEEYIKRWENLLIVAEHYNLRAIKDEWDHDEWLEWIKGHESDPERSGRCSLCFRFNLLRAEREAEKLGIDMFTTSLTVSSLKKSEQVFGEGRDLPGFVEIDFKKKDGFNKSVILSKQLGLYRQTWCGCEFSRTGHA